MVVQHNLQAMNANRMLNVTTGAQSKSTEKLSSGYKINRAADDAAGLSISEKMRKQIRGLDQASSNAQDGVSAVQTAEGALTEVHSMLQRMNELAVQSANGTNSKDDRDAIQSEIDQLSKEIDRVSETTKFNEIYLLKGSATKNSNSRGLKAGDTVGTYKGLSVTATQAKTIKSGDDVSLGVVVIKSDNAAVWDGTKAQAGTVDLSLAVGKDTNTAAADTYAGTDYTVDNTKANLNGLKVGDTVKAMATVASDGTITLSATGIPNPLEFNLHVGSESAANNKISVTIESMGAESLGIKGLKVDTEVDATASIDTIEDAIKKVSAQRSALGAIQNRLEHTIDNLDNVVENTTAAESRIRDTDMAEEMVNYSKNNILAQAGQSMLAQANQSTQGVLSLLQ